MIPSKIIEKKRDGYELTSEEINWFVTEITSNKIDDSQLAALLMSIYFNDMSYSETNSLVKSMVESGRKFNFQHNGKYVADKHSTGGVGDKISFILAPLLSSFEIIVPMIAGRSLAYTGGTIDKLESIPNFQTEKNFNEFSSQIENIGCGIISQSSEICPVDKKLYSIRDLTSTIPSLPLICSSIMSKKIAEGLDGLVMDIKVGNGTFMKTLSEAKKLSVRLKKISQAFNIKLDVTYSNMSQPLGKYAGLRCEIIEAIDCLKGNTHNELVELSIELCTKILLQSGVCKNKSEARIRLLQNIENGSALKKFEDMIIAQNGDLKYLYSENRIARNVLIVKSKKKGFIKSIDTEKIGWALVEMGCGRKVSSDHLDFKAGIKFNYKIGDLIYKDDPICELFCSDKIKIENASKIIEKSFLIDEHEVKKPKLILN